MNRILKAYLKRLTNLSTRNKSLLLGSLPSEQFLDVNELDFLLGKPSFELIRDLIQRKPRIPVCDLLDARFEKVNEVSKKLRKISRTENFIEEERGSRDLYVGYPFIKGKLADGTPIHAPLLFFPVTIQMHREQWCLSEREEEGIILNRSFALAYSHFNEIGVGDEILEKSFEDFSRDALEFHTQLYEWLKDTPFRINFNQQLFEGKLSVFDVLKSADLDRTEKNGELKLFPEAVLGIFPQAGSYLVPDYNYLLEQPGEDLYMHLLPDTTDTSQYSFDKFAASPLKEEDILTPFSLDESQEEIIRAVKSGKSVVVQGPPGSGKSQLICNLMADFASQGKRVLLVCQKRAALDVVYQRLKTIGMDPFVALIHDFKNDRSPLYHQLATQIEKVESYREQNYGLDAVFLERQFTQESRLIDRTVESLQSFRQALFDDKECGVSIKELYLTSNPHEAVIDMNDYYRFFRPDNNDEYKRKLRVFGKYALLIHSKHAWHRRRNFSGFGLEDLRRIESMLAEWPGAFARQLARFQEASGAQFSEDFLRNRTEAIQRLTDFGELLTTSSAYSLFKQYITDAGRTGERLAFIRQTTDTLEGFLSEGGIELTLDKSELVPFQLHLKKAIEAKSSAVSGLWFEWFGSTKKALEKVIFDNKLSTSPEHLVALDIMLRNRIELESWLDNPLLAFDHIFREDPEEMLQFFQNAEKAADAVSRIAIEPWLTLMKALSERIPDVRVFTETIVQHVKWLRSWDRMEEAMSPYLLPSQMEEMVRDAEGVSTLLLASVRKDFDVLVDMDQLWDQMLERERAVTQKIVDHAVTQDGASADKMVSLFENSIRVAWVGHIESKFPDLRAAASLKMDEWEEQLQGSILLKQKRSSDIVGIHLRERTYENVEKNRLGNRVTYRELNHQVTKKRKIWPIRKLLEGHRDEVFSLVPCWMASPEAVSALFPMESGLFDLVIFDEASQCYAEYGLPASFRGKQVVIAGDSKQLSPSDLYRVRYVDKPEEEESSIAVEIESLLDLAAQSLDQYQLSGHYRSASLDLIDFSNHHFYKDSLRLLPDFNKINSNEPGIKYIRVDGVWKGNANIVEAQEVVSILRELKGTGLSIGIVTFNFFQQQVIQDAIEREDLGTADLFVKNIENVQGDERDVIIFTMGYAPDEKGKLSMQFGSLNMAGGENRLNVAITRARERIYFVTSLMPSQLSTDQLANAGPKLLKEYMQYAFDVSEGNYMPRPFFNSLFRSEWLLKDRLAADNTVYKKELPFADLTIKEGKIYKGLLLTDDDQYNLSRSAKEPHAYLPLLLKLKNWPFQRAYSRTYWKTTGENQ